MPKTFEVRDLEKSYPQALLKKLRIETWPYAERHHSRYDYLGSDDSHSKEIGERVIDWALLATGYTRQDLSQYVPVYHQVFSNTPYFSSVNLNKTIFIPMSGKPSVSLVIKDLQGDRVEVPFQLGNFYIIENAELFSIKNPNLAFLSFITFSLK